MGIGTLFQRAVKKENTDIAQIEAIAKELQTLGASCAVAADNLNRVIKSVRTPALGNAGYIINERGMQRYRAQLQALRLLLKTTSNHLPAVNSSLNRLTTRNSLE